MAFSGCIIPANYIYYIYRMNRFNSYINTAKKLIETYTVEKPFAIFLKQFFAQNKKYGANDRKQISALCFNYFRMGFGAAGITPEKKMLMGTFLCEGEYSDLMENLMPQWSTKISRTLNEKLDVLATDFSLKDIFPFGSELSDGIEITGFCKSFLVQPDLFIRLRPQTRAAVLKKLKKLKLPWKMAGENCVQLTVSDKLEDFFVIDKEVVVQDYNSQKVLDYLKDGDLRIDSGQNASNSGLSVWDCCAASGGKSILLNDIINRKIDLTVSDIRPKIIWVLHQRFKKAGINEYKYFIADINSVGFKPGEFDFDLIICDAPCTGSGTWSRTPEQLCFFKQSSVKEYSALQKKIITNVLPHLYSGGLFIYITCSVFKKENEVIAEFIAGNFNCKLLHQELLPGYTKKADSMFVAVFRKL